MTLESNDDAKAEDRRQRLTALFSTYGPSVLRYALRRTRSATDAEDAVSETFLVAWRHLAGIPEDKSLSWLLGVCRRVLANQRRGAGRRSRLLARLAWLSPRDPGLPASGMGHASTALSMLSESDQELLRMIAWDDLSYEQIATILSISPNAVAVRAHRARSRFRTAFAEAVRNRADPDTQPGDADG